MKAFFERKIEEIRREPEHVRLRYVWGAVAVVMVFLFLFWIMTLRDGFRSSDASDMQAIKDAIPSSAKDLEKKGQSIQQTVDGVKSLSGEGMTGTTRGNGR